MEKTLLPTVYLGNVYYYQLLTKATETAIEIHEHFVKQTYRNRCCIYGANGPLNLIIPLVRWRNNTDVKDIKIAYDAKWQQLHWRSIESAYRSSPFFEYYEDDLLPFYEHKKFDYLIDFNESIQQVIIALLQQSISTRRTQTYVGDSDDYLNYLQKFTPKKKKVHNFPTYFQVFQNKMGFIENLSVIDVLFNLGPETVGYLSHQNSK